MALSAEGQAFLDNFGTEKSKSVSIASTVSPAGKAYLDTLGTTAAPADQGVVMPALKRGLGTQAQTYANVGELVGIGTKGLADYGKKLVEENPAVTPPTLAGFVEHPWTAIKERTAEQAINLGTSLAGTVAGVYLGGPIGALTGASPKVAGAIGAYLGGTAAILPSSIGEVGLQQEQQGVKDPVKQVVGGAINAAIEQAAGAQYFAGRVVTGLAEKGVAEAAKEVVGKYAAARAAAAVAGEPFVKNVAPTVMRSIAGVAGKALSIAAGEAAEEVPQNEVSRWSAHQDVLTKQSLQEDIDNAASAFAGSLLVGAVGGVQHQVATNKAVNAELASLAKNDAFQAQPEGTQAPIPGTAPKQAEEYVAWAEKNSDAVGDKRISRYGVAGVVDPKATFTDVNDAIKLLESGAPVTALKTAPQIKDVETQIADMTTKIGEKVQQTQAQVADQQQRVADTTARLEKAPDDPAIRAKVMVETAKLTRVQQQVDEGAPAKMTEALAALNTKREALLAKIQPLDLAAPTPQVAAQESQRQKMLDKLHQVRGDMAYFQDQAFAKTLEDHPEARDTLTRDLFDAADARDKAAQEAATSTQRATEFDQAQAQVEQQKQEQLDLVQAEAPARTFSVEAPATVEPTTALGQALTQANVTAPVQETVQPATTEVAPTTPAVTPAPAIKTTPEPVVDNAAKLSQVYQEIGKTPKEAAALVRTLTKNVDVTDTQAISDKLVEKANSPSNQTSFETLDKLHKAVTGLTLNEVAQGEQNVTSTASQAPTETQAKTQAKTQGEKVSQAKTLSSIFNVTSNMTAQDFQRVATAQDQLKQAVTGKTVQEVARHVANTAINPTYQVIANRIEARLNALQKQGMKFDFQIVTPENESDILPETSLGMSRFEFTPTGSKTTVLLNGRSVETSGLNHITVLHELVHAATQTSIEIGRAAPKTSKEYRNVADLVKLFNSVADVVNTNIDAAIASGDYSKLTPIEAAWMDMGNNAFENIHELVAWAMTDKKMQAFMESIPYKSNQSVWSHFVESIRNLLGLSAKSDTALSEILRVTEELMNADLGTLNAVAQKHGVSFMDASSMIEEGAFNKEGYITAESELGNKIDNIVKTHPTLAAGVKEFLTAGVQGTTSSLAGKGVRVLEKNFQSPLHLASKSQGFSLTWDRVRQIPAHAGYILNRAFGPLEHSWVKGMDVTKARLLQFATGIENTTFQDLVRAETFLHEWNVSGMTREEFLQAPTTIAKFGDMVNSQDWFARVEEARQAIDYVLDAQFTQNAEDMRSVVTDDQEFEEWLVEAQKTNEARKDTGYMPIRRYGDYSVAMYDTSQRVTAGFPSGDLGLMGKWFFQTELEAREFIKDVKEQFKDEPTVKLDSDFTNNRPQYIPKAKASQYSYSNVSFRQFLEIARRANVPISMAEQQRLARLMINADSMYQNKIQRRKNVPGGTKDIVRTMSEFVTHLANKVSSDRMAPRISEAMNIAHPLSPEDVSQLGLLQSEFQWAEGTSELQTRDAIHDRVTAAGGSLADEITELARFNKMKELESNGFLTWRTSVDINKPQEVAEYYDLLGRSEALSPVETARFDQLSTPDPQAGFYHDKIAQHVEFLNNPKGEAFANLRRFAAINFLGASVSAMIVNLSSLPLNFMPYMHQYGGMSAYTATMHWFTQALSNPVLRSTILNNNTAELEKALAPEGKLPPGLSRDQATALLRAFREEVISDTQVFEYFAAAKHGVQIGTVLGQRAQAAWMAPFRVSEMTNRLASFMAAYEIGQKNEIDGKMLGAEEQYQFARKAVDQTQFIYGPINRSGIAQNPVGFALMTFRAFPIMTLELLARLPAKQRTIMLGTMLMASGLNGIPFKEDIADILDMIGEKLFGMPLNTNRVLHNFIKSATEAILGADLSRLMMTGPLDVLTGASIGSRVSMSNIIPATRIGTSGYTLADGMLDLSGVIGSEVRGFAVGAGQLAQGNIKEGLQAVAPTGAKGVMRFTEGVTTNRIADKNGNTVTDNLTMGELGLLGAGFTLSRSNWQSQKNYSVTQENAFAKETTAMFFKHAADAIQKGDYDSLRNDFEAIQQWNQANPEYAYNINPTSLRRELLTRNLPAGQRELMKIKKAWRGAAAEDLLSEE